jgi:hypothetical protein
MYMYVCMYVLSCLVMTYNMVVVVVVVLLLLLLLLLKLSLTQ